jgi:2-polyprenyl-3-methyl-5-hydroxy-6-metoxy-1,4-benzoquinol methylase
MSDYICNICQYFGVQSQLPESVLQQIEQIEQVKSLEIQKKYQVGFSFGNTEKYLNVSFPLWKCPTCESIHSLRSVDFLEIYKDYPVNKTRPLDFFARTTLKNLLRRINLKNFTKESHILDFGCGNANLIHYLEKMGYQNTMGFDLYVENYQNWPSKKFDLVIANDVIEHVEDPFGLFDQLISLTQPNGYIYVGTSDSKGVLSMQNLEDERVRLHQPFHRKIISQTSLLKIGAHKNLKLINSFERSYMDTLIPFCNYRFLDEFIAALGYNMDAAFRPDSAKIILQNPQLLYYAYFGYFCPSALEPAALWQV